MGKYLLLLVLLGVCCTTAIEKASIDLKASKKMPKCQTTKQVNGRCALGWHVRDKLCKRNTCGCHKYDAVTYNCASCKWWAWQVENDRVDKVGGTKTGNFCQTAHWFIVFLTFLCLWLFALILGIVVSICCKKKEVVKPAKKPKSASSSDHEVEVEAHAPEQKTRGPVKEWTTAPVVREYKHDHLGDRVHVETRVYSPGREVQREFYNEQDWAKYSNAHWHEH